MQNGVNSTNEDSNEILNSIEDIYTKQALALCSRPGDDVLIPKTIKELKSRVYMVAASPMTEDEKEDNLLDMLDYIDQDLLKHTKLVHVLGKFIRAEFKVVSESLRAEGKDSQRTKEEIIKTLENDDSIVSDAERTIESSTRIIEKEKEIIEEHQKIIETAATMLKKGSQAVISAAEEMINDAKETIENSEHTIKEAEAQIQKAKDDIDKQNEVLSLENEFIDKIRSLYDDDDDEGKTLASNAIKFMSTRITDIVRSPHMNIHTKKTEIKKQPTLIKKSFLKNYTQAIEVLKIFIVMKGEQTLKQYQEEQNIISQEDTRFVPPLRVSEQLNKTYKKFKNKEKCTAFIKTLYGNIPHLLQSISSEEDPAVFKAQYIMPVLKELEIPEKHHLEFLKIADMYRMEERVKLFKLANDEVYRRSQLLQANLHLEAALLACNNQKTLIETCHKFVTYIQINLPSKLAEERILEKQRQRESKKSTEQNQAMAVIQRMQRRNQGTPTENLYDQSLNAVEKKAGNGRRNPMFANPLLQTKKTKEKNTEELAAEEYLSGFPDIPKPIKEKLRLYVISYYNHVKSRLKRDETNANDIFKGIVKKMNG